MLSKPGDWHDKWFMPWHRAGGKMRGASLQGGKMRGTVRYINAMRWVICEAGMCKPQRTTGAAGVVVRCEPLKRN